ncbi:MAG: hypothetical protein KGK03_04055 [Candidatus Omnitrophica bacterium]|nr:hypothetical protein [Candidatus Omnitrophota bacterium]MDE2222227.1 hypothetical protein [Candidatus Omnitrophota bacterium]
MRNKIFMGILMLVLLAVPQLSYADWGVGGRVGDRDGHHDRDDHRFYGWYNHPQWGWRAQYVPAGFVPVRVGWQQYYYYNGWYYTYINGNYVPVNPPVAPVVYQPGVQVIYR